MAVVLALSGCGAPADSTRTAATDRSAPSAATPTPTPDSPESGTSASGATAVRFTSGDTVVEVAITPDNSAAQDFLSMLPLTLSVEEYGGREKISYLPRDLDTAQSPGSRPEVGDLSYYAPWGNLVFYYNTDGISYSDQTIHLGTYNATSEQLTELEGDNVTVEVIK
ncbi:cyclophilin-like fold protein [Tomitella biformata]|uniref:cyclophilin-like fold protein n=1 Tax=Tomitella biformata TaxID=630403 RepID=UPI0004ACD3FA|nr:cyclophilin-like fold protein [Tomitella biformata]